METPDITACAGAWKCSLATTHSNVGNLTTLWPRHLQNLLLRFETQGLQPPADNPHDTLKEQLIIRTTASAKETSTALQHEDLVTAAPLQDATSIGRTQLTSELFFQQCNAC